MIEILDPQYARTALEALRLLANATASLASRVGFDDSSRLRVRTEFIDDGYVRVRVDTATAVDVNLLEILREMSWTFYNLSQQRRLLENLDVALSTRASESTLSAIAGALASKATDKLRVSVVDSLPLSPVNLTQVSGTNLTARDWSQDFAKLQNLDAALSTRASESTLSALSGKFPSAAALSDSLSNPTTTIVGDAMLGFDGTYWRRVRVDTSGRLAIQNQPNLDVALSTRASESTLSALSGKFPSAAALADNLANPTTTIVGSALLGWDGTYWRRVAVDTSARQRVVAETVANPPNLDVALSTRASESTLSALSGKFPSAAALSDSLSNPTTTLVGSALLGFDGTYWRRVTAVGGLDAVGTTASAVAVVPVTTPSRPAYTIQNISVSTTEGSTSISAPGAKILILKNKGDTDALIGINGTVPTTNPLLLRARTVKVVQHKGVTQVNYKTASGTTTLEIEYIN